VALEIAEYQEQRLEERSKEEDDLRALREKRVNKYQTVLKIVDNIVHLSE